MGDRIDQAKRILQDYEIWGLVNVTAEEDINDLFTVVIAQKNKISKLEHELDKLKALILSKELDYS